MLQPALVSAASLADDPGLFARASSGKCVRLALEFDVTTRSTNSQGQGIRSVQKYVIVTAAKSVDEVHGGSGRPSVNSVSFAGAVDADTADALVARAAAPADRALIRSFIKFDHPHTITVALERGARVPSVKLYVSDDFEMDPAVFRARCSR